MADAGPTVELVIRYQNGDEQAKEKLAERLLPRVYEKIRKKLYGKLAEKEEPEDIGNEAIMDILKAINTADTQSDKEIIKKIVNQIVKEKVADKGRFHGAIRRDPNREKIDSVDVKKLAGDASADGGRPRIDKADSQQRTPSQIVMRFEIDEQLNEAMDQLKEKSPDQWELIWKHLFCHLTLKELALEMDKKYDAVRMQYYRAVAALTREYFMLFGEDE